MADGVLHVKPLKILLAFKISTKFSSRDIRMSEISSATKEKKSEKQRFA